MAATHRYWSDVTTLFRFGAVGALATLLYFVITAALGHPAIGLDPIAAHVLGTVASLFVSYFGHHRFTFQVQGAHDVHFPRFLIVTAALFVLSTAVMAIGRYGLALDHTLVTAAIAIGYPLASYGLNRLWTFAQR